MIERMLWALLLVIVYYYAGWAYSGKIEKRCAYDSEVTLINDATIQCNVRVPSRKPLL